MKGLVPAFTTYSSVRRNVLTNEVEISSAYDPSTGNASPIFKKCVAIWDTGATTTAITKQLSQECGLKATGMAQVRGVHSTARVNVYLINLRLPNKVVPAFTTYSSVRRNVLTNEVEISSAYDPSTGNASPIFKKCVAIWDTGATTTAITKQLSQECGLKATGMAQVRGVHSTARVNVYLINLRLPNNSPEVEIVNLHVNEADKLADEDDGAQVLIGMDVIGAGDFAVSNYQDRTTFTFRLPSQEQIDFLPPDARPPVLASRGEHVEKVGRNDPCPCGSGKKYKKCHGL